MQGHRQQWSPGRPSSLHATLRSTSLQILEASLPSDRVVLRLLFIAGVFDCSSRVEDVGTGMLYFPSPEHSSFVTTTVHL